MPRGRGAARVFPPCLFLPINITSEKSGFFREGLRYAETAFDDRIVDASIWATLPLSGKKQIRGGARLPFWARWRREETTDPEGCAVRNGIYIAQCDSARMPITDRSVDFVVTAPALLRQRPVQRSFAFFPGFVAMSLPGQANWQFAALRGRSPRRKQARGSSGKYCQGFSASATEYCGGLMDN